MALEGGMKCVKFLVFFFNFLFWLCGVALIVIGILVQIDLNKTLVMSSASASGAPIVIIVVGVVIFFVSFFGCCGASKENYCMVTTFAILLTPVSLLVRESLPSLVLFNGYIGGHLMAAVWDPHGGVLLPPPRQVRTALQVRAWRMPVERKDTGNDSLHNGNHGELPRGTTTSKRPNICCWATRHNVATCNVNPTAATINVRGCADSVEAWLKKHIVIVAAVALGIAFFELLGIVFACCLMRGIRSGYEVM
ncbi:CD63 antigen [Chelonoidis abingdonii]|uniref:CD63 antigen n=1 Tax=Chelonoidis abingdonii TaxID=106734 RepID=UPI003F494431